MREGVEGKERQLQNAHVCTGDRKMGGWLLPGGTVRTRKRGEERRGEDRCGSSRVSCSQKSASGLSVALRGSERWREGSRE